MFLQQVDVDYVLVCTGIEPNTSIGSASGITVADGPPGGFVADSELNVAPNVWVVCYRCFRIPAHFPLLCDM